MADATTTRRTYTVGTLKYTAFGLGMLFVWLLWGDFVNTLLDGSIPSILPLKLKDLGASDTTMVILNRTFGYSIAFLFGPMVSFNSDRHRGRWGRRIPYLVWSTPFVGLFMVLIGYYDSLVNLFMGNVQHATLLGFELGHRTVTLVVFGVLFVGFDFANIFVGTAYWYLFNDVVPQQFLSRFLSLFRMVGILAGMLYSKLIFPHALDHFRLVFVAGGIAYVVGFLLMCIFVKEGEYPPPSENVDRRTGLISSAKTYFRECFTSRFYWCFFLMTACFFASWQSSVFSILRNRDSLGLTLQQLGDMAFYVAPLSFALQYPAGWLADKYHPFRIYLAATVISVFGNFAQSIFIFRDFGPHMDLVILYAIALLYMPVSTVQGAAELPMFMRLLPKERYGQYHSANAMIRNLAMIFSSVLVGMGMEFLHTRLGMGDWRYRYYPVWTIFFQVLGIFFLILLYRAWKARGGDQGYTPPGMPQGIPVPGER